MSSSFAVRVDRSDAVVGGGIALVVTYFAALVWATNHWSYDRSMLLVLLPVLFGIGIPIIAWVTRHDDDPLTAIAITALTFKLAASFGRYFVSFELYGSGDALRYDEQGTLIATAFHNGDMTLTQLLSVRRGTALLDDVTGILYSAVGPSQLGGFLVFSFIGFWGLFLFHRAALIGCPEADQRRYALLVLFLPSLLFWPSSIGKEAVMLLSLGLCAYGSARVLERRGGGWVALGLGLGIGYLVRPHVPVVVLAALSVAIAFRPRRGKRPVFGPFGRMLTVVVLMVAMAFVLSEAVDRFLPARGVDITTEVSVGAVGELLDRAESGTSDGGSEIDRPSPNNPLEYPGAVFTVLFRPTLLEAGSAGNTVAALETTFILVLAIVGWRRLKNVPAVAMRQPYVLMCVVYTGIFTFAWSSFANLGALARQRVQVWPFVLLLLAVPALSTKRAAARASAPSTTTSPTGHHGR